MGFAVLGRNPSDEIPAVPGPRAEVTIFAREHQHSARRGGSLRRLCGSEPPGPRVHPTGRADPGGVGRRGPTVDLVGVRRRRGSERPASGCRRRPRVVDEVPWLTAQGAPDPVGKVCIATILELGEEHAEAVGVLGWDAHVEEARHEVRDLHGGVADRPARRTGDGSESCSVSNPRPRPSSPGVPARSGADPGSGVLDQGARRSVVCDP